MKKGNKTSAGQKDLHFSSKLVQEEKGIGFHYVEFPHDVFKLFGKKGPVRIIMEINGLRFRRALIPQSSGLHRIIIGGEIRKKAGLIPGDILHIKIEPDPEPLPLEIPEELESVFELETDIRSMFDKLAPGMKRNICTWINEGKKVETRVNRALEILRRFQSGKFNFGGQTSSKNKE